MICSKKKRPVFIFFILDLLVNMSRYVKQLACRFHPEATLVEDYRAGDMVCPECGLVVGDRYERWRG